MKKFTLILTVFLIAVLTLTPVFGAVAANETQYYIAAENGKAVNLRSVPEGALVISLGVGKPVTVLADTGYGWTLVSVKRNGQILTGYVMSEFLSIEDPSEAPQTFETVFRFPVTVVPSRGEEGHVNLRAEADATSVCLSYLQKDDVLTVLAESNAWYRVRTSDGIVGYVAKGFVTR